MAHGLVTPLGTVSHTGVGGLTLGGGFGRLARRFGMSIDNLESVDVVTADGQLRHASANENPDLFWGVRGGGGNFGVVTNFEFRLHPMQREVIAGSVRFPIARARDVLSMYRRLRRDRARRAVHGPGHRCCRPEALRASCRWRSATADRTKKAEARARAAFASSARRIATPSRRRTMCACSAANDSGDSRAHRLVPQGRLHLPDAGPARLGDRRWLPRPIRAA